MIPNRPKLVGHAGEAADALHVISFPKSGRTWLRVMLDDIGVRAKFSHDRSDHRYRRPWSDLDPDKTKYSRITLLLMVRDPRDTAVSGYFQVTRRLGMKVGSLSKLLRDDRHGITKVCQFNLQWFAAGHQINRFAILSYEQLHRSPAAALMAVVKFAGTTLDEDTATLVTSNRSFERMRAAEASGELAKRYGEKLEPRDRNDAESFKVRRGAVGAYPDYLSMDDIAYCEAVFAQTDYWSRFRDAVSRWGIERLGPPLRQPCDLRL